MGRDVTNVVVAGLGGQGVLKATDIIATAALRAGLDVKKSEVHGMSQRGGSVRSDVRFGPRVISPMVPQHEADYLVVAAHGEEEGQRATLRDGGLLVGPDGIDPALLPNRKCLNVALLGQLSRHLPFDLDVWRAALAECLPPKLLEANLAAFELGRRTGGQP